MSDRAVSQGGCLMIFAIVTCLCVGVSLPINIANRLNGEHTGYITAVEDNVGIIPDNTTTVYVKTELSSSQEDTYCIQDSEVELIKSLRDAARNKTSVVVKFNSYSLAGLFNCEGDRIVGIESVIK